MLWIVQFDRTTIWSTQDTDRPPAQRCRTAPTHVSRPMMLSCMRHPLPPTPTPTTLFLSLSVWVCLRIKGSQWKTVKDLQWRQKLVEDRSFCDKVRNSSPAPCGCVQTALKLGGVWGQSVWVSEQDSKNKKIKKKLTQWLLNTKSQSQTLVLMLFECNVGETLLWKNLRWNLIVSIILGSPLKQEWD